MDTSRAARDSRGGPAVRLHPNQSTTPYGPERIMESTVIYAFLVVACAPLIGIWRAHAWARKNGFVLREERGSEEQVA